MEELIVIGWPLLGILAIYINQRKGRKFSILSLLLVFLEPFGLLWALRPKQTEKIVTSTILASQNGETQANIYNEPNITSNIITIVNIGETYRVIGRNDNNTFWALSIQTPSGTKIGWIEGRYLGKVDAKAIPDIVEEGYGKQKPTSKRTRTTAFVLAVILGGGSIMNRDNESSGFGIAIAFFLFLVAFGIMGNREALEKSHIK